MARWTGFAELVGSHEAISRSRAVVARQAHNLKVVGSIPSSATERRSCVSLFLYPAQDETGSSFYGDRSEGVRRSFGGGSEKDVHIFGGFAFENSGLSRLRVQRYGKEIGFCKFLGKKISRKCILQSGDDKTGG